jgi:Protein of unknown function (DUF1566)
MQKDMPKLGVVLMAATIATWVGGWVSPAHAQKARVAQTGQTQCWDTTGTPITCAGTGQDGDIQAGVPFPTVRFRDNGNGTVEDELTGLIWLKNANCFSFVRWAQALTAANTLHSGSCGLTDGSVAGDWPLPNVKELQSLIDFGQLDPALPTGHPFSGVQSPGGYWSSTTAAGSSGRAWVVVLSRGGTGVDTKVDLLLMWPVRGGQ